MEIAARFGAVFVPSTFGGITGRLAALVGLFHRPVEQLGTGQGFVRRLVQFQLNTTSCCHRLAQHLSLAIGTDPVERIFILLTGHRQHGRRDLGEHLWPGAGFHIRAEQQHRLGLNRNARRSARLQRPGQGLSGLRPQIKAGHHDLVPVDGRQLRVAFRRPCPNLCQDFLHGGQPVA